MLVAHPPLADELGVHVHDDVVVFRMNDAEAALIRQHLERLPDIAEVDHAAAARRKDIGGEYLERRVAGLDRLRQLPGEFRSEFASTWNASQISPKSTMRPLRDGRILVVNILSVG